MTDANDLKNNMDSTVGNVMPNPLPAYDASTLAQLKAAALSGDLGAQKRLAQSYALGEGVVRDDDEAAKWYEMAAAQGDPEAITALAHLKEDIETTGAVKIGVWQSDKPLTDADGGMI